MGTSHILLSHCFTTDRSCYPQFKEISAGLAYLHIEHIVHADLRGVCLCLALLLHRQLIESTSSQTFSSMLTWAYV